MRGGLNQGLSRENSSIISKFGDYIESFDRDQGWVRNFRFFSIKDDFYFKLRLG